MPTTERHAWKPVTGTQDYPMAGIPQGERTHHALPRCPYSRPNTQQEPNPGRLIW